VHTLVCELIIAEAQGCQATECFDGAWQALQQIVAAIYCANQHASAALPPAACGVCTGLWELVYSMGPFLLPLLLLL